MTQTTQNPRNKATTVIIVCIVTALLLAGVFLLVLTAIGSFEQVTYYENTNIAEYGKFVGNYNNAFPAQYINSFFPAEILDGFSNVVYSYRAKKMDAYGFEAYLEFTIDDTDTYSSYISSIAGEDKWQPFLFDSDFMEYSIDNILELHVKGSLIGDTTLTDNYIEYARIGKILCSHSEQRIIFVAIGVYDGGGTTTSDLSMFFNRFSIDPIVYLQTAEKRFG